ncbi:hypothetical protein ABIC65_003719 [Sphingomonas trueperi]|uniref:PEPxxWA-CTERM sorting domain-containing protein n=1 Tax=Sphingomonas trueperi TaxID=53317 RepID=UPI0033934CB7
MIRSIVALVLAFLSTPAVATTYVGTSSTGTLIDIPGLSTPGTYRLDFSFSRPLYVYFEAYIYREFWWYRDGEYIASNDGPDFFSYLPDDRVQSNSLWWIVSGPFSGWRGDIFEIGYYRVDGNRISFGDPDDPSPYSYRVDVTSVPEPAQWTLLITGFGLAGAALRRRVRASTRSAATA